MSDTDEETAMWPGSPYALVDTQLCPSCFATPDRHHLHELRPRARRSPGACASRTRAQHRSSSRPSGNSSSTRSGSCTALRRRRSRGRAPEPAPEPEAASATRGRREPVPHRRDRSSAWSSYPAADRRRRWPPSRGRRPRPHARTRRPAARGRRAVAGRRRHACDRRRPRHPSSPRPAPPAHGAGAAAHPRRLAGGHRGDLLPRARLERRRHPDAGADHRRHHPRDDGRRLAAAAVVADGDRRGDRRTRRDPARPRRLGGAGQRPVRRGGMDAVVYAGDRDARRRRASAACGRSSRGCADPTSPPRSRSRRVSDFSSPGCVPLEPARRVTAGLLGTAVGGLAHALPAPWSAARSRADTVPGAHGPRRHRRGSPCRRRRDPRSSVWSRWPSSSWQRAW